MKCWLGLFAMLAVLAAGAWIVSRPAPGISWRNLKRIHAGMSQQEVEAVIGMPPQTDFRGPGISTPSSPADYENVLLWSGKELDILVYLDKRDRVIACEGHDGKVSVLSR